MNSETAHPARRRRSRVLAVAATAALALGGALAATAPASAAAPEGTIDDAVLQWGLNGESGGGAFAGGCNFLSAGTAGSTGASRPWTEADGFYHATEGNVSVLKPNAAGDFVAATWASKCLSPAGTAVAAFNPAVNTGNVVNISGGEGTVAEDGSLSIEWDGSFTVVFYGGFTYWTASDPVLTLDANGDGQLTATASGYGADMNDPTIWVPLAPQQIVLADIDGADADADGFTVTPNYLGVEVDAGSGTTQVRTGATWGSFPQSFVDFQFLTGQSSYWYSSGGSRDAAKPTTPLSVAYTVTEPEGPVDPGDPGDPGEPEAGQGDVVVEVPDWVDEETGTFGWAWAGTSPVDLGTATQDGANFVAAGALTNVVVTDTRAGGTSPYTWSVSGQVGDFASDAGSFGGGYLGWTPKVVSGGPSVSAGAAVTSTQLGGTGLGASSVLASSTAATSATVGADLQLVIPGTTPSGDYKATITVTALQ